MKFDSIEIGSQSYRIEFNWNTISEFLETENKTLADLDKMAQMSAKQITRLIWCGLREGCRLNGNDFTLTVEDVGAMLNMNTITEILKIYTRHTTSSVATVKPKKKNFLN